MEEENILKFKVYVDGPSLLSMTDDRMFYPDIIEESIFSSDGYAPVISFNRDLFEDNSIEYTVTVDAEKFKTPFDFSKAMNEGLKVVLKRDRKIENFGTFNDSGSEAVIFNLNYALGLKDLGEIVIKANALNDRDELEKKKKELESELEEARQKGWEWRVNSIEEELDQVNGQLESIQKIELLSSYSASENELKNRALEVEEKKGETSEQVQSPAPATAAPPSVPIVPPVAEKSTISLTRETSAKESNLVQTILNNIAGTSFVSNTESIKEGSQSTTTKGLETQIINTIVTSVTTLLQKEIENLASSMAVSSSKTKNTTTSLASTVPATGGLSGLMSTVINTDRTSTAQTDTTKENEGVTSTISDSIRVLQSLIEKTTKDTENKASDITKILGMSSEYEGLISTKDSSDTSSLTDVSTSSEKAESSFLETLGAKLFQTIEKSELISNIQQKIIETETSAQNIPNIQEMVAGIGDSIKSVVTNISSSDKTMNTASSPTTQVSNANVGGSISETDQSTSALGNQNIQNLIGGPVSMPSVVSLSQNTIDSLASAIIKNMSIAPFLNAGR